MFPTAALIAILSSGPDPAVAPDMLTLSVEPVTVRRGDPVRLVATLTYLGDRPLELTLLATRRACWCRAPKPWELIPYTGPRHVAINGIYPGNVTPGGWVKSWVDVTENYYSAVPPGVYTIRVGGGLAVAPAGYSRLSTPVPGGKPEGVSGAAPTVGRLRANEVDVTVTVTER